LISARSNKRIPQRFEEFRRGILIKSPA
jgi:hypothetical protein